MGHRVVIKLAGSMGAIGLAGAIGGCRAYKL